VGFFGGAKVNEPIESPKREAVCDEEVAATVNGAAISTESILSRAALLDFVAALLSEPRDGFAFESAQRAAAHVGGELVALTKNVRAAFEAAPLDAVKGEWARLFATQMACPPYESEGAQDAALKATILSDVSGFYAAWGMRPSGEMADHIVAELSFASHLLLKLAYAQSQAMTEQADIAANALAQFASDHLAPFAQRFFPSLYHATRSDCYKQTALLGERAVKLVME
jgi:TorA maturation chaperone TorD